MLYTDNIGLKKPAYNEPADIADINENSDIIDREFGNRYLKSETYSVEQANNAIAQAIEALPNGLVYRGAVNYYKDLPTANNELGDTYSVKYQGETGTAADGNEYAWGEYDGSLQWIKLGVNAYTKDEIDEQLSVVESDILTAKNDIAVNRATLGTQITKNVFDLKNWEKSLIGATRGQVEAVENGIKFTHDNSNAATAYTNPYLDSNAKTYKIPVEANTEYILSWETNTVNSGFIRVYFNGQSTYYEEVANTGNINSKKFKTTSVTRYLSLQLRIDTVGESTTFTNIMVRKANTNDTYEPYVPSLQEQINALVERIQALETAQATT